ncbi:unnamed protein product [Merluccius merluccius]
MTKVALAKLLILVVLIFIICIPDYLLQRGLRVDFQCVPCPPAEECGWLKKRHADESGRERRREGGCDPCLALGGDRPQPDHVCRTSAGDRGNGTDPPGSDYSGGDPGAAWFMCETDVEEAYFSTGGFTSDSPEGLEVWVEVRLEETIHLNLVLYDQRNASSSYLRPPEEPEDEADGRQKAFYCCLPPPPTPQPTNHSRCLIRLANQTALAAVVKEAPSWEWTGKKGKTKGGPLCGKYKGSHLSAHLHHRGLHSLSSISEEQ